MNTRFKSNVPHPNAINMKQKRWANESRQPTHWNSIEEAREAATTTESLPEKVRNDGAHSVSHRNFVGFLCGSVFSRSLISCTSNRGAFAISHYARRVSNASFAWLRQSFRVSTKLTTCSVCHSIFGWLCAISLSERITLRPSVSEVRAS